MASSLDGKIGPAKTTQFVSITSAYDMNHLKTLRDEADGVLFGAGTFRTWPKAHEGHDPSRKPRHFILSHSLALDSRTPLFKSTNIPLTIFSSSKEAVDDACFPEHVKVVLTPEGPGQISFILEQVKTQGVRSLLIEGGGTVLYQFIEARALEELFLTVTPKLIGQAQAPELLGGQTLSSPPKLKVLSSQQVNDELYLHLGMVYSSTIESSRRRET